MTAGHITLQDLPLLSGGEQNRQVRVLVSLGIEHSVQMDVILGGSAPLETGTRWPWDMDFFLQ